MKTLYQKAEYLWTTLANIHLCLQAGVEIDVQGISEALSENRPEEVESKTLNLTMEELQDYSNLANQIYHDIGYYESQLVGVQDYLQERQDNDELSKVEESLLNKLNKYLSNE